MNRTEEIAYVLNVADGIAHFVRDYIDEEGLLDWSECTHSEMIDAIVEAANAMKINGRKYVNSPISNKCSDVTTCSCVVTL